MTYNLLCPHEQLYSEVKSEKENRKWERQTIRRSKILERNGWSRSQINKSASDVLVFFRGFWREKIFNDSASDVLYLITTDEHDL